MAPFIGRMYFFNQENHQSVAGLRFSSIWPEFTNNSFESDYLVRSLLLYWLCTLFPSGGVFREIAPTLGFEQQEEPYGFNKRTNCTPSAFPSKGITEWCKAFLLMSVICALHYAPRQPPCRRHRRIDSVATS